MTFSLLVSRRYPSLLAGTTPRHVQLTGPMMAFQASSHPYSVSSFDVPAAREACLPSKGWRPQEEREATKRLPPSHAAASPVTNLVASFVAYEMIGAPF